MNNLRYLVPNGITCAALACGVISIVYALSGEPLEATWWVMVATLLDRMDGAAARVLKASSALGGQLDSFADFISFGLAPAFIFYGACAQADQFSLGLLLPVLVFTIGCAVRLARFGLGHRNDGFDGVPSTLAGGFYACAVNVAIQYGIVPIENVALFAWPLLGLGLAMNVPWLHYGRVGGGTSKLVKYVVIGGALASAVCILSRQMPEVPLWFSGTALLFGPLLDREEGRRMKRHSQAA